MKNRHYYIYIPASKQYSTLYIGVTSDLIKRISEHSNDLAEGFTKSHNVHDLVYEDVNSAIAREKQLKNWKRKWKIELIERENPNGETSILIYSDS